MNFDLLLKKDEAIKKLPADVMIDIRDYRNMINGKLPHMIKWDFIKSYIITTNGRTIWQLSEQFLDSEFRPIGCLEPGVSFINWMLQKQLTA